MNRIPGDGLIAAARADVLARRDRDIAERERLERLISRHRTRLDAIPRVGAQELLAAAGALLAERVNAVHGTHLHAEVSGPFGMAPDWYLSLRDDRRECWAIVKVMGDPERLTVRSEADRGPGTPFPDDLSDLVALFEAKHLEDEAKKACAKTQERR